mgnify:CR=1 FL=1
MAKKRRKLNKDFERKIYSSKKNVELVLAKIYDIDDEDIQKEYMSAFNEVVNLYDELKVDYENLGFNDNSEELLINYKKQPFIYPEKEFDLNQLEDQFATLMTIRPSF